MGLKINAAIGIDLTEITFEVESIILHDVESNAYNFTV